MPAAKFILWRCHGISKGGGAETADDGSSSSSSSSSASINDILNYLFVTPEFCHYPGCCHVDDDEASKFDRCSRCHKAKYCSRACQKKHWHEHKELCIRNDDQ